MPDTLRRFRRHPIYSTIGALFATMLIGLTSLVWLGTLLRIAMGQPFPPNAPLALAVVSILAGWYVNFMMVSHRLRRVDPQAYAWATNDMGFIAFIMSTRGAPAYLHNALARLDLDQYPATFRYHVRFTLLLNAAILWACCAVALGFLAMSLMTRCMRIV